VVVFGDDEAVVEAEAQAQQGLGHGRGRLAEREHKHPTVLPQLISPLPHNQYIVRNPQYPQHSRRRISRIQRRI
jgi:hypothetical protein